MAGFFLSRVFTAFMALMIASPLAVADSKSKKGFDHIVVVIEENHGYSQIIGSRSAPFINGLARQGALLTKSFAVTHPSQPNYFALYAGDTFGVSDDFDHTLTAPSLASIMGQAALSLAGYVETGSPRKHNPWESFTDSAFVERPLSEFPALFARLPRLAFVIPNLDNDMHDGSVARADAWLRSHLSRYATWAKTHRSLLLVTFDEDNGLEQNRIASIFVGAGVKRTRYNGHVDHYRILKTICDLLGTQAPGTSATAKPIRSIFAK